jgi:hypothetical protein
MDTGVQEYGDYKSISPDAHDLFSIPQKVFVAVAEKGTEAAAATAVIADDDDSAPQASCSRSTSHSCSPTSTSPRTPSCSWGVL